MGAKKIFFCYTVRPDIHGVLQDNPRYSSTVTRAEHPFSDIQLYVRISVIAQARNLVIYNKIQSPNLLKQI